MKIVFFRTPKPKQFSYPPRYYDEEKEHRAMRRKELGLDDRGDTDFKTMLNHNWNRMRNSDRSRKKKAEMSVLVYFFIVAILVYIIFFR
ncbi:MAG TPA: hypothetical protein P5514_10290 [Bacteroidales bacterium]|nr:hypothetical protein [Bacteroidales bacterium]HPE54848.1 hypothetical protein [Bacteroidales bacterium]HRX97323.1 hypothetical protein [Bacteroidales bacterium]